MRDCLRIPGSVSKYPLAAGYGAAAWYFAWVAVEDGPSIFSVGALLLCLAATVLSIRLLRTGVLATKDQLTVRNVLRTRTTPWSDVRAMSSGDHGFLKDTAYVLLQHGERVWIWALQEVGTRSGSARSYADLRALVSEFAGLQADAEVRMDSHKHRRLVGSLIVLVGIGASMATVLVLLRNTLHPLVLFALALGNVVSFAVIIRREIR